MTYDPSFYKDIIGMRFGKFVLTGIATRTKRRVNGVFVCDCGSTEIHRLDSVKRSKNPMCKTCRRLSVKYSKHNPLYGTWIGMMGRCYNKKSPSFKWYGGKGIGVCEPWRRIVAFSDWAIANGWYKGCNIDRIDPSKDYSPENCRIVSALENQQNRTNNVMLEHDGETKCVTEWERELGFKRGTIQGRMRIGITGEALFARGKYKNDGSRTIV